MLVAIPTAIPWLPLTSKFGKRAGITKGSSPEPSKVGARSTVSSSMLSTIRIARSVSRHSVYLYAAGGSFGEPKLPWGSISVFAKLKVCPIRTIAS